MNQELLDYLLKDINAYQTKLEKAIYLYIKLCKLFTYDEVFYIMNYQGDITSYYENFDNIKSVTLTNNKVVCYTFNFIYANLLDIIGVKYQIQDYSKDKFTKGHANLMFFIDGFQVIADSVTSILMGDLSNAKLNYPLNGLICKNKKEEFAEILNRIYISTLPSLPNINLSLETRLHIIITKVLERKLSIIDAYSYFLSLRNYLFTYDEKMSNFKVSLVKDNTNLKPIMIISLNEYDFDNESDETTYYLFDNHSLTEISIEDIRSNFINNTFEYFENDLPRIPNLNLKMLKK